MLLDQRDEWDRRKDPIPRVSVVNLDSVESESITTLVERLGR